MTRNPEQALWCAVLKQIVLDAIEGARAGCNNKQSQILETHRARNFLTSNNADFRLICEYAGFDPVYVHERITKLLEDAPTVEDTAKPKPSGKRSDTFSTRMITMKGVPRTIAEWADHYGLSMFQVTLRLNKGWSIERALTQPVRKVNRRRAAAGAASVTDAPGVGMDFRRCEGTGGGRSAQDRPKISFSPNERVNA